MAKRKSVSDGYLNQLWRKAVLIEWNYTDPISGHRDPTGESLQCHHIVYRRHFLLRWDYKNGIPLTVESHHFAHTAEGRRQIDELVDTAYLYYMERQHKKEYLMDCGMSENEFRLSMKRDLLERIESCVS